MGFDRVLGREGEIDAAASAAVSAPGTAVRVDQYAGIR